MKTQYNMDKVTNFIQQTDKKQFSGQELIAIGKVFQQLGEVQKETDYLDQYLQATLSNDLMGGGGTLN